MVHSPIQTSFAGGELSQRLRGRVDADLYKHGLARCENFRPTPQGSLLMRAGTEKVAVLTGDDDTRIVRFRMSDQQDYLLELLDFKLRIYDINAGRLVGLIKTELLTNGDFHTAGGAGWTAANAAFAGESCQLTTTGSINQQVNVATAGTLTLKGKFSVTPAVGWYVRIRISVGTTPGGTDVFNVVGDVDSRQNPKTLTFVTGTVQPGNYYFTVEASPSPSSLGGVADVDDLSCYLTIAGGTLDEIPTPWAKDEAKDVHFQPDTGSDRMLFTHPRRAPWMLTYVAATDWSFGNIAFNSKPAEWTGDSWPDTVEVYNGRAWYAKGNRFWASKAGTLNDMTVGSNPGDALDFKLASKGAIRWLQGQRTMLVGTDLGEQSISGSNNVVLVNDIQVREESSFGSCRIQGINVGTNALFVTNDRREVRALSYDLQTSGWDSKALTFIAEHVTKPLVKELHFVRHPEGSIVCVLEDGTLAVCAFDPTEGVVAWWRLTVGGQVLSAATSQGPLGAFLWLVVKRGPNRVLEKLPLADATGLRYLDSSISAVVPAGGVVPGLSHLEDGTSVRVVLDGAFAGDFEVAGGEVQLEAETEGKTAIVGLAFRASAQTLPREVKTGKARDAKVGVLLADSALPLLNGKRPPDRTPATPQDQAEARRSGRVHVANLGWSDDGVVTLEQDLPFRTEVLALFAVTAQDRV